MTGLEIQSVAELEFKGKTLGLVWVVCSHPVIAQGLESILKDKAQVHLADEPPEDETISSIVLCPRSEEDDEGGIVSEVKRLKEMVPHAPILLFALGVDQLVFQAAFGAGASGYLHSGLLPNQIISAVSLA